MLCVCVCARTLLYPATQFQPKTKVTPSVGGGGGGGGIRALDCCLCFPTSSDQTYNNHAYAQTNAHTHTHKTTKFSAECAVRTPDSLSCSVRSSSACIISIMRCAVPESSPGFVHFEHVPNPQHIVHTRTRAHAATYARARTHECQPPTLRISLNLILIFDERRRGIKKEHHMQPPLHTNASGTFTIRHAVSILFRRTRAYVCARDILLLFVAHYIACTRTCAYVRDAIFACWVPPRVSAECVFVR